MSTSSYSQYSEIEFGIFRHLIEHFIVKVIISFMHNLRDTLGKEEDLELGKGLPSRSGRGFKNNNSQSMWSVGVGSDEDQSQDLPVKELQSIQKLIGEISGFKREGMPPNQELLSLLIRSSEKTQGLQSSELQKIQEIQLKLSKLLIKAPNELQPYVSKIIEIAKNKRKKLKSKTQSGAMEFDEITQKLFKRTAVKAGTKENKKKILQANLLPQSEIKNSRKPKKNNDNNGTKNSGSGSQQSGQGKLGKLLSSEKYDKKKSGKEEQKQKEGEREESYTFSAVINATTVRQRPRIGKKDKEMIDLTNPKKKMNEEDEILGNDREDDAFIFFRPKRNRR